MKMSRRARRMERNHRRNRSSGHLNLVPMIDLLTVLVFFLLVNAGDVQNIPNTKMLKLPESSAQGTPKETVMVMVNNQDIVVDGRKVAAVAEVAAQQRSIIPALVEELTFQLQRTRTLKPATASEPGEITIMGDREIPYELLKKIMVSCTQAGYSKVSLAVAPKGLKAE